jgi:hypothetical protein
LKSLAQLNQYILESGTNMAEKLDDSETVSLEELVVSHSYEMIALITVLERKGILTRGEVIDVIKEMGVNE